MRMPQFTGLPNIISSAFVDGIDYLSPSGPGTVCQLIFQMLVWCNTTVGDDKATCIDRVVRLVLTDKLASFVCSWTFRFTVPDHWQRVEVERLAQLTKLLALGKECGLDSATYLTSMREDREKQLHGQDECLICHRQDD